MAIEKLDIQSSDEAFVAYANTRDMDATLVSEISDEFNFERHPNVSFQIFGKGFTLGTCRLVVQASNDPDRNVWTTLPGTYSIDGPLGIFDQFVNIPNMNGRWARLLIDTPNAADPSPTLEVWTHGKR